MNQDGQSQSNPNVRLLNVKNCSSCGQDHDDWQFKRLHRSFEDLGHVWEWWGECPITGDPVFARDLPMQEAEAHK